MRKTKKVLLILILSLIAFAAVIVLCISPITKYLVEKYDEKFTGRRITMDWAYVNPFTGFVHLSNLKIYEYKSDSIFISVGGLSANFSLHELFSRTIHIEAITLGQPYIVIAQTNLVFNFDDLIKKFSSKGPPDITAKPVHVSIQNIRINDGHFFYLDRAIPVNFSIKKVQIESKDGWQWDNDMIAAETSFLSEAGTGGMKGTYSMNLKTLDYNMNVVVNNFDLKVFEQYFKGFSNYGTLRANLDADLKTNGCFRDAQNINIHGQLAVSDFHFGKNPSEDYLSFDRVTCGMREVNPMQKKYMIDSVLLVHPYFKYEIYDRSDNVQSMFGTKGEKVATAHSNQSQLNLIFTIGEYIEKLAKNFLHSNYKVNTVGITQCDLCFNDYSQSEKFSADLNPLNIRADSIYKNHDRVIFHFDSPLKPYGNLSAELSISPESNADFDLNYFLDKLPLTLFNPYIISLSSFPLDRGTLEFKGHWKVRNGVINSTNHLVLLDPRLTKRVRNKDTKWIPAPLIMAFVRERGNVIDYEIPVTGDLKDPKFHLRDVLLDLAENIVMKPPTTPYRLQVRNTETEIEKLITIKWQMRQNCFDETEKKFMEKMAGFLQDNPAAHLVIRPKQYALKEKEQILFFEAKKKYFMRKHKIDPGSFCQKDSLEVARMSVKDSCFVSYLNNLIRDSLVFTIQEKCSALMDSNAVNLKFNQLSTERRNEILACFKLLGVEKQIKFSESENVIPFNGFSYFKIDYKDEYPESLIKAYHKMNEFNNAVPRNKFKKERIENRVGI